MNSTLRWLWRVMGKKKGYTLALTLIQAASSGISVLFALVLRGVVDNAVGKNTTEFWRYVFLMIGIILVQVSIGAVIRWLYEAARSDMENTFKQRLADRILRKDYASVSATHTGEWLNRLTNDSVIVANGTVEILPGLVGTVVRLVSALILLVAMDRWFAVILIPAGILMILVSYAFRRVLKRLHKKVQESDGKLRIFLQERISSLMVIKSFGGEDQVGLEAERKMREHRAARLKRNRFSNTANVGLGLAMWGMYLVGVVYCAHGILTDRVTYGTMTAVMQLIGQVQGPFASIAEFLPRWYALTASAERLMEAEAYADDSGSISPREGLEKYYENDFQAIGFEHVSFTYLPPSRDTDDDSVIPDVLHDLTLEIGKGEYVGFIGPSGCGKSTALKLLMCLYPPDSGTRYLKDGTGKHELTAEWRGLFAYVPQGNHLMNGTIREIVTFGDEEKMRDEERLQKALKAACADSFVSELEYGIDTMLGERGAGISEGQMQRIAIARAIFSDHPILLLDEATSSLDIETETRLLASLRTMTDRTVIVVTHRRAALSICDRILQFTEDGVTLV